MRAGRLLLVLAWSLFALSCDDAEPEAADEEVVAAAEDETAQGEGAAADAESEADPEEEEVPALGTIEAMVGAVKIKRGTENPEAAVGAALQSGDTLETGDDGKVRAVLSDKTVLAIGPKSGVVLAKLEVSEAGRSAKIDVLVGKFWAKIEKWAGGGESSYEIETPNAVAGIRGTTLWGDTERDVICSLEGEVQIKSKKAKRQPKKPKVLKAGKCANKLSKGKVKMGKLNPKKGKRYLKEVMIP